MIVVPVPVEPGADDLQVVDDVEGVAGLRLLLLLARGFAARTVVVRLLNEEQVESAVARGDHVADLHFFRQGSQIEPHLLRLAVHVDV